MTEARINQVEYERLRDALPPPLRLAAQLMRHTGMGAAVSGLTIAEAFGLTLPRPLHEQIAQRARVVGGTYLFPGRRYRGRDRPLRARTLRRRLDYYAAMIGVATPVCSALQQLYRADSAGR